MTGRRSRLLRAAVALVGAAVVAFLLWSPGSFIRDGRHDLRSNAIWIQHGWLGDDSWFSRNRKDPDRFRNAPAISGLARLLESHGVRTVFPHLCPCHPDGTVARSEPVQVERFLDEFGRFSVLPWVGGVLGTHAFPESAEWRSRFASSASDLIASHPRLAGIHLNIEPMPSGNIHFLTLLEDLRRSLPPGKQISVAAYPPPTVFHPFPSVHWEETYFRDVARRVDQLVPMMYDTAIRIRKLFRNLLSEWTVEVLAWSEGRDVLLGVPAYDDDGVGYHDPSVENLGEALPGIHGGLGSLGSLPANYSGVAIYSEWEMDERKWKSFKTEFERP